MTFEGFRNLHDCLLDVCKNGKHAYEKAEQIHECIYGDRKYTEYRGFTIQLSRLRKKKKAA